jgi:phosphotriesterase-related protein
VISRAVVSVRNAWPEAVEHAKAYQRSVERLSEAKAAGVDTIVDLSTPDFGRDARFVSEVATKVGMPIIMCTGFWEVPRYFHWRSPDVAARLFVRDITEGIQGTQVKAGIIKVASVEPEIRGPWELAFRAAARAHRSTGVPITTHSDVWKQTGLDQQRLFAEEGVDLTRVVIGHCADAEDMDYVKKLLDRGSTLCMDRFGIDFYIPEQRPMATPEQRVAIVAALCRQGYADQLVLSHDAHCYCDHRDLDWQDTTFPDWRFRFVPEAVVPALLEAGVSSADVDKMTRLNPQRLFERQDAY